MDIPWWRRVSRGVSPVIGVALMVVLTILLASTLTFVLGFGAKLPSASPTEIVGGSSEASGASELQDETIIALNKNAGATDIKHSAVVKIETTLTGESLKEITITYPANSVDLSQTVNSADNFYVLGIDTDGDGEVERKLSDDIQSMGLNNNNEITVGVDSSYSLKEGDRILIKYKAVDNPDAAGEYSVDISVTTSQETTRTITGTLEITV